MPATNTHDAGMYVSAGCYMRAGLYADGMMAKNACDQIKDLLSYLDKIGFAYPRSELERMSKELASSGLNSKLSTIEAQRFHTMLRCVESSVTEEASKRRVIAIQESDVSMKLQDYAKRGTLTTVQTYLYSEAVKCLETGAYRSAVVMGWNLIYDRLRNWVFTDAARLGSFNTELAKILNRAGSAMYNPIVNYEDFYEGPNEAKCIDLLKDARIAGEKDHGKLRTYLRRRNEYAHASDKQPTASQANGLLEDLLDTLDSLGI